MSGLFSNLLRKNSMDGKEGSGGGGTKSSRAKRHGGGGGAQRLIGSKTERSRSTDGHVIPPRMRHDHEGNNC